jgi:DNA mismatch repair protein MutS
MRNWFFNRRQPEENDGVTFSTALDSLLWPPGKTPPPTQQRGPWEDDIGLRDLVQALGYTAVSGSAIRQIVTALTVDVDIIRWRQAVLEDLRNNPAFVEQIIALLPRLSELTHDNRLLGNRQRGVLLRTSERLAELEVFTDVVLKLHEALSVAQFESAALNALRQAIIRLVDDASFQHLRQMLPELRRPLQKITSLTIGVNLDTELHPRSAILMAINDFEINEPMSFLGRVLGADSDASAGIAPLNIIPGDARQRPLSPLFQDLEKLMTQVAEPVERVLRQYANTSTQPLVNLAQEFGFFIGALMLMQRLQARGVPVCQPEIRPAADRHFAAQGLVNMALVLHPDGQAIPSDVRFDQTGRIAILTGPNSGGKTTYLRSVGLAQVMAQAGLFVTAQSAQISPVDAIYTHFPALETRQQGRLAEEATRLRTIFQGISEHSLVLLNETFATTASSEAIYLAQDMLCGLRMVSTRAIFATHLTELYERISEIEAAVQGESRVFSLVAGITLSGDKTGKPTYVVKRGEPLGRSYAREIAQRHGIELEQLRALRDRAE